MEGDEVLASHFITPSGNWDIPKLNTVLWPEDVNIISKLPITSTGLPDSWI